MGKRGPPKTPLAVLKSRGSWRADERSEAEMPEGIPVAPDWLKKDARAEWFALVPILATARIIRQSDRNALARYCELWSRWRECEEFLKNYGQVRYIKSSDGTTVLDVIAYPQVAIASRLAEQLTKLEDRFGLSPSARTSVGGSDADKEKNTTGKARFFA